MPPADAAGCDAADCWSGPCRFLTAAPALAAAGEVPLACPDLVHEARSADELFAAFTCAPPTLTPAAADLVSRLPGAATPANVARLMVMGELVLLVPRVAHPIRGGGPSRAAEEPATPTAAPEVVAQKSWIRIRLIDDRSGERVGGVKLLVRDTKGVEREYETLGDGAVELHEIDPGACAVRCELKDARLIDTLDFVALGKATAGEAGTPASGPPARGVRVAEIEEHKVRTGESIASLAAAAGMSWQALAVFNWGTAVPDQINKHLRSDVGCTKKAADGVNYRFDDSDDPGIIYIPRQWSLDGLATDQEHTIRVRSLEYTTGHWVEVCIIDDEARPLEGLEVELIRADGSRKPARTDARGVARWERLPNEKVRVAIEDGEYALEAESEADEAAAPAAVAVADDAPADAGGAGSGLYDGEDADPQDDRRPAGSPTIL